MSETSQPEVDREDIRWYYCVGMAGICLALASARVMQSPGVLELLIAGGMFVVFVMFIRIVAPERAAENGGETHA